jgi:tRNA(fMet)-specific endonuclease VapC
MAMRPPMLYLLDTNMAAYIANGRSNAARSTMNQMSLHHPIAISAIVEGETFYGLARKPEAKRLRATVEALFSSLSILPWDSAAAQSYAAVRARMTALGVPLSTLDMLIAAHAVSVGAHLVTHDKAFLHVEGLSIVDWATDLS